MQNDVARHLVCDVLNTTSRRRIRVMIAYPRDPGRPALTKEMRIVSGRPIFLTFMILHWLIDDWSLPPLSVGVAVMNTAIQCIIIRLLVTL